MTTPDKSAGSEKTPFQKFQAVARKIINVPKSEVDRKIAEFVHQVFHLLAVAEWRDIYPSKTAVTAA
jgi:hypothetical protein